jgi:hypothetical protein
LNIATWNVRGLGTKEIELDKELKGKENKHCHNKRNKKKKLK